MTLGSSLRTLQNKAKITVGNGILQNSIHHIKHFLHPHGFLYHQSLPFISQPSRPRYTHQLFDEIPLKDISHYNRLLFDFSRNNHDREALDLFKDLHSSGLGVDGFTLSCALKVCGVLFDQVVGRQVHCQSLKSGFLEDVSVGTSLVDMYMKTENFEDGRGIFDEMVKNGFEFTTFVCNALICMYLKSEMAGDAEAVFDSMVVRDSVTWNIMIGGYAAIGFYLEGFQMFHRMRLAGVKLSQTVFCTILKLCSQQRELNFTKQLHCGVVKNGYEFAQNIRTALMVTYSKCSSVNEAFKLFSMADAAHNVVTWTAMIDAYVKMGNVVESARVFYSIPAKDIVAWSAMLTGLAQTRDSGKAMEVFIQLAKEGAKPNEYTFSSVINACSSSAATVEQGKQIHAIAVKSGKSNALCVSSALLTMYSKKGNIESAEKVFNRQEERDTVSWNSMITGYGQHGDAKKALEVFQIMQNQGLPLDDVTFIGVLTACTHAGLVEEGEKYFNIMIKDYHIDQTIDHYSCMVDLYSRAGMFDKAIDIINGMPFPANPTMWRTLLAACRVHRNLELGKLAAEKLVSLQPNDSVGYVLLSNIHAVAGNWEEKAHVRKLMDKRKIK
uniref:Pentatricopeptide repeat-containing protein n=1 Tax=Cucumis melo TaxID=3656 RepID=A0A9I9CKA6_CUCME